MRQTALIHLNIAFALVLALGTGLATPLRADNFNPVSTEVLFRQGYAEIIYDAEYIPTLGLKVGYKTLILLPSDERIVRVEVGVRGTALEIKYGTNWVAIRPNIERLATNLHVATDQGRVYSFDLVESGGPHKEPHKKVVVLRPDMELDGDGAAQSQAASRQSTPVATSAAQAPSRPAGASTGAPAGAPPSSATSGAPGRSLPQVLGMDEEVNLSTVRSPGVPGAQVLAKLDDGYRIKNEKPKVFKVERVYNDGMRTFVVFKSAMLEAPLFYRIDPNGKREILTYRMEPAKDPRDNDVFVIPRLVDRGTVKMGDYESTFVWKKAE